MEQNTFQKVQEIIEHSGLSNEQKREFSELFARTKEEALVPVLKLFAEDSTWVLKLYNNYAQKREAFVTGNIDAWEAVIESERSALTQ